MAGDVKELAKDMRDVDRRLSRVETALELLTKGAFAAPPIDVMAAPVPIEDKTAPRRRRHKK